MSQERFIDSLRDGISEEMRADPRVIIFGEDVAVGGAFGVTGGLADEFGDKRVINTPISEDTIMGMAVGAAVVGKRPIVEIMFMDFMGVCMDEIVNQMAKMKYMLGGLCQNSPSQNMLNPLLQQATGSRQESNVVHESGRAGRAESKRVESTKCAERKRTVPCQPKLALRAVPCQ